MELNIIEQTDDYTLISLNGRLDLEGVQAVDVKFNAATAGNRRTAIVDMTNVDFIASLGLGMLVAVTKSLGRDNAKLMMANLKPEVRQVLVLSKLDMTIGLFETVDDAKAAATGG